MYELFAGLEVWPDTQKIGYLWYSWHSGYGDMIIPKAQEPGMPIGDKGIEIIREDWVMGDTDFTAPLTKFADAGVDLIWTDMGSGDFAMISKQATELGLDFHFQCVGTATNLDEFIDMAGYDNAQGMAFAYTCPWTLKKSKVKPELVDLALRIAERYEEESGKPMTYMGAFNWGAGHLSMLLDLYQQAGTTDPDVVMELARGGTVNDFTGNWTLGGEETWGAPVVKPVCCALGVIQGREVAYGAEYPQPDIP